MDIKYCYCACTVLLKVVKPICKVYKISSFMYRDMVLINRLSLYDHGEKGEIATMPSNPMLNLRPLSLVWESTYGII